MKKRKREILLAAQEEGLTGLELVDARNGHLRLTGYHGHVPLKFTVSSSPSCAETSLANFRRDIRRAIRGY